MFILLNGIRSATLLIRKEQVKFVVNKQEYRVVRMLTGEEFLVVDRIDKILTLLNGE